MSKLNDIYHGSKRHAGKILAGCLIVVASVGIRSCIKNMGEEVYKGNIDGYSIVYEENRFTPDSSSALEKNRMTAKKGDITYLFEDDTKETTIDWKNQRKPSFEEDNLEKIVI